MIEFYIVCNVITAVNIIFEDREGKKMMLIISFYGI